MSKKNPFYDEYLINNIKNLIAAKKYDKALFEIAKYKENYSLDKMPYVYEARVLAKIKKYNEAEKVLKDLLSEYIERKYVYYTAVLELADILRFQKKYDEAIENYKICIKEDYSTGPFALIKLTNIFIENNKYEEALDLIEKSNFKENVIYLKKASIKQKLGNNEEAFNILISLNDSELYITDLQSKYYTMAKIYIIKDNYEEALKCIDKCIVQKNKYYWKANVLYAKIKSKLGKEEEAIEMCKDIIKNNKNSQAMELIIKIYIKIGLYDLAKEYIELLYNENHESYQKYYFLAKMALANSNYQEAEELFTKALIDNRIRINISEINYYLIITKFRLGKYEEVMDLINKYDNIFDEKDYQIHVKKDLNVITNIINNREDEYSYTTKQLRNYSEEEAIKHIIERHYNENDFNPDIIKNEEDLINLFYEIRNNLNKKNRIIKCFCDIYVVNYNKIGNKNGLKQHNIEVVCIPDTYNIITMYITNKFKEFEEKQVVLKKEKRLSQIDKFYKRYGKV